MKRVLSNKRKTIANHFDYFYNNMFSVFQLKMIKLKTTQATHLQIALRYFIS